MAEQLVFDMFTRGANQTAIDFVKVGQAAGHASDDVASLARRLNEIGDRTAAARVRLDGNDKAQAQIDKLDLSLIRLGRRVAQPQVKPEGLARAALELAALNRDLDKLDKTFTVRVGGGGIGGIGSKIGNLVTGSPLPLPGALGNPAVAGGAGVGILATLPFIAQAAAGAITLGLGGALAGIGVYAESGVRRVQYQFSQLWSGSQGIQATLKNISPAFGQALATILNAARTFVPTFIRAFGPALNAIAGPFKSFGVEIAGTLASPQIAASLLAVGKAFGSILTAITPAIPGIVNGIADGFTNIAKAVARNPKAFADLIIGLGHVIAAALDVIGWLTNVADYIEQHFVPAFRDLQRDLLNWTLNVAGFFIKWGHDIEHNFDDMRSFIVSTWNAIWKYTYGAAITGIQKFNGLLAGWEVSVSHYIGGIVTFFEGLPRRTIQALSGWGNDLNAFAHQALNLLWEGAKAGAGPIVSWFEGFAKGIVGIFKKIWGWFSPSAVMYDAGKSLMQGLALGIKDHAKLAMAHATSAAKGISTPFSGGYGVGVTQWTPQVLQALKMEGLGSYLASQVLYQMMTESGGNPNAINLWDVNAQHGDPSRGLMQVIMSTFDAYHWPGTSWDIYDPLANIAAAINYAAHRYGPTLMSGGQGIGSGHGYAAGTGWAAPGWAWVGERGPELVRFRGGEQVYPDPFIPGRGAPAAAIGAGAPSLDDVAGLLEELIGVTAAAPGGFAGALNGMARSSGYGAMYNTRP